MRQSHRAARLAAVTLTVLGLSHPAAATVTLGLSSSFDVTVSAAFNGGSGSLAALNSLAATAPAPFALTQDGPAASLTVFDPLMTLAGSSLTATSTVDGSAGSKTTTAVSTVNTIVFDNILGGFFSGSIGSLSASATVTGDAGALIATGTSTITDGILHLAGIDIPLDPLLAANTVLYDSGGITVIGNEQIVSGDGLTARSMSVNALDISFDNVNDPQVGLDGLTARYVLGHSEAQMLARADQDGGTPIPEPASIALLGAGLLGLAGWRTRQT